MSGKSKAAAQNSANQMPNGTGSLKTPEMAKCHPGETPKIEVSPASLDFGRLRAGAKLQKTITIKNAGDGLLTIQSITLSPNPGTSWTAPMPTQTSLKSGKSVTVTVSFEGKQTGNCAGTIEVQSNATEGSKQVDLKAKVFALNDPSPEKFLAPGADDEDYKILYTVDDPGAAVDEGELQILDKDKKAVWSRSLTEDERKNGKHEIAWKGQITAKTGYPDGYLTVESSPYTSRVSVKVKGAPEAAQVESIIKVQPHSLKISLGDKAHLKQDLDKAVYDEVTKAGGLPPDGQKRKVYLISNRFSTKANDDHHDDDTSFLEHKNLWGGGAAIPLVATVWLKTSAAGVAESKTLAPQGLGNARVLWDFTDVPEDTSGLASLPKTFVDNALAWAKGSTEPPGDNCAGSATTTDDRGGKRADNGSTRPVLLASTGLTDSERSPSVPLTDSYPYAAARGTTRRWSVLAEVLKTGANKGTCGIIFQGSRMGGDAFKVQAYLDVNRELDRKGDLPEFIKNNQPENHPSDKTGTFEIWKELHILTIFSKNGSNIHKHAEVTPHYEKAYVRLVDKTGGTVTAFVEADYNTAFQTAIGANTDGYVNPHAINDDAHQFTGTAAAIRVHPRATFESNFLDAASTPGLVTAQVTANPGLYPQPTTAAKEAAARIDLRNDARADLLSQSYTHGTPAVADQYYWTKCNKHGGTVAMEACNTYMDTTRVPGEGIAIFVFAWSASNWAAGYDGLRGQAIYPPSAPNTTTKRSGYMQFATNPFYASKYPDGSHNMERTVAHEIGHLVHLPHTRDETAAKDDYAHDWVDRTCIMGYNYNSVRNFCGYCLLRLRGWNHTNIKCGTDVAPRQNGKEAKIQVSAPADQSSTKVNKTAAQTFTIKNTGPAPLVLGTIALEGADKDQYEIQVGDDKASGQTIGTGASKTLKLTFKPTSTGDKTVTLRIPSNDPAAPTVITFTSKGEQPAITVTPANLDFGDVPKNSKSAEKTLTLKNTGTPELVIDKIELVGPYAGDFIISTPASSLKLAKDATTTVKIKFDAASTIKPDKEWEKTAQLRIVSNESASPRDIDLKGKVKLIPKVEIQNPPPTFTDVWVGKESAAHEVTLKSIGSNNLELKGLTLEGTGKTHFVLRDVPPNGTMANGTDLKFKVVYKPTAAGSHSAKVKVDTNGDGNPHFVDLNGTAVNPPTVEAAASVAFPATKVGADASQSITVKNKGGTELVISGISGATAEFVLGTAVGTGIKVAAGATTTLDVKFVPGSTGTRTATLTVTSNDPATPSATITLTGTGT